MPRYLPVSDFVVEDVAELLAMPVFIGGGQGDFCHGVKALRDHLRRNRAEIQRACPALGLMRDQLKIAGCRIFQAQIFGLTGAMAEPAAWTELADDVAARQEVRRQVDVNLRYFNKKVLPRYSRAAGRLFDANGGWPQHFLG